MPQQLGLVRERSAARVPVEDEAADLLVERPLHQGAGCQLTEMAHHHQVEEAVPIVVAPCAAGRLERWVGIDHTARGGGVRERSVALAPEQSAGAAVCHVQVLVAVVVVVGCTPAIGMALRVGHSRLPRHVGEGAVPIVPEQGIRAQRVGEVGVVQPVAVVVEHEHARANRLHLRQVLMVTE